MGKKSPRRGSRAFWRKQRAVSQKSRVRFWNTDGTDGLCGFAAYKAGMTTILTVGEKGTPYEGTQMVMPVTLVEAPSLYVYSIIAYKKTVEGLKRAGEVCVTNAPKQFNKSINLAKKTSVKIEDFKSRIGEFDLFRVIAFTQPFKANFKKTSEVLEIALGGDKQKQLDWAQAHLGKEVPVTQFVKPGDYLDIIAVTKGHGWQGLVKRMGVALQPRKATKRRRHGGSLGGETQAKIMYTVPRAGQYGYFRRTELNKKVLTVSEKPFEKPIKNFGVMKNPYLMIKGSIAGPEKRLLQLRKNIRNTKPTEVGQIELL
ncbi:50S ribosomal protein L3 [Candidatus Micrarchaeota archaeon]|nr:50S ribosomal protein L3 [Candidatus Micrarchaeota archaeon]